MLSAQIAVRIINVYLAPCLGGCEYSAALAQHRLRDVLTPLVLGAAAAAGPQGDRAPDRP